MGWFWRFVRDVISLLLSVDSVDADSPEFVLCVTLNLYGDVSRVDRSEIWT